MREIIKNIGISFIAIIVLLSSISFTVHKTYCKGTLVNTSIFDEISVCNNVFNDSCSVSENCCSHKKQVIDGQTELQISKTISYDLKKDISFSVCQYFHLEKTNLISEFTPLYKYNPPPLIIETHPLFQIFII